jgi:hypothetical protein
MGIWMRMIWVGILRVCKCMIWREIGGRAQRWKWKWENGGGGFRDGRKGHAADAVCSGFYVSGEQVYTNFCRVGGNWRIACM